MNTTSPTPPVAGTVQPQPSPSELTTQNSNPPSTASKSQTHKLANSPTDARPGGRPTKLTPTLRDQLLECLSRGMNYSQACAAVGIDRHTLRAWRKANASLGSAIEQAEAKAVSTCIDIVLEASQKNWRAAAWWLERKCPEVWGQTKHLTVARKLEYAYQDRSPAHEAELTPTEIDLRTALYLAPDAPEEEVHRALERAKINLMRSRAYGIPVDQLPK